MRSELRPLTVLALPVIVSQFSQMALGLINTAVVGRLGAAELAAVAYAGALYYLVFLFLQGIMLSVAPRMSRAFGAGDHAALGVTFSGGLALAALVGGLFLPVVLLLTGPLTALAPADVRGDLAGAYLGIYALTMIPALGFSALRGSLESTGAAQSVTRVAISGVLLAALLSPALTYGWGGLPALGVRGAALSSVVVGTGMTLTLFALARRRLAELGVRPRRPQGAELRALLRLGFPIGLNLGAEGGMFSVVSLMMAAFGAQALAAHNLALQIISAAFMIPLGLSIATSVRVGQALGRGDGPGLRTSGFTGIALAAALMAVMAAVYVLAPLPLIGVFVSLSDPANAGLIAGAVGLLAVAALFQLADGVQVGAAAALRGLQDTFVPMLIALGSYWLLGVGGGYLLAHRFGLGPQGLWWGLFVGISVAAVALGLRFHLLSRRRRAELTRQQA